MDRRRATRLAMWALLAPCCSLPAHAQTAPAMAELQALPGVLPTPLVRLRYWGFEVYDARLWTRRGFEPEHYARHAFALELQYLRRLDGAAIASRSIDEMRRVGRFDDARERQWLAAMQTAFPDVQRGDRITGVHRPGQGAQFWFNGQWRADVPDPEFAALFFGIWLHERTSVPQLRAQLISGLPAGTSGP